MSGLKRAWADDIFLGNAERDAGECRTQAWRVSAAWEEGRGGHC